MPIDRGCLLYDHFAPRTGRTDSPKGHLSLLLAGAPDSTLLTAGLVSTEISGHFMG